MGGEYSAEEAKRSDSVVGYSSWTPDVWSSRIRKDPRYGAIRDRNDPETPHAVLLRIPGDRLHPGSCRCGHLC